jgi:UDP-GlcNAc:undecaprenyl-phosphate GlcNAc-1-phosphate transferase
VRTLLIAFGLSLVSALFFTRVVRDLANKRALSASAGDRKLHTGHLPQLGGVAVAGAFALPLVGLALFYHNAYSALLLENRALLTALTVGGAIMFAVGIADDLWGLRARHKFVAQLAVGLLVYSLGIELSAITFPILGKVELGLFTLPATIFWIALVTNAINLIDGLDGLAAGVVSLATLTLTFFALAGADPLSAVLLVALLGATLGFLVFNFSPATIILGDSGSLLLGYSLALLSLHSVSKSAAIFSLVAATMALGVPIFDLTVAIIRRAFSGVPIFSPDQHHIHHQLLRRGMTQRRTMLTLVGAAALLEILSLTFLAANDWISAIAVVCLVVICIIAFELLGYRQVIRHGQQRTVSERIEADAVVKATTLTNTRMEIKKATSTTAVWEALQSGVSALGYEKLTLQLDTSHSWSRSDALSHPHHLDRVVEQRHRLSGNSVLTVSRFCEHDTFEQHDDLIIEALADCLALWLATSGGNRESVQ